MKWEEVQRIYPNAWVKFLILDYYIENDKKYITEVALIGKIDDAKESTRQLVNCKSGELVYHTNNEIIKVTIRRRIPRRYLLNE